jgi:hypothetical protein
MLHVHNPAVPAGEPGTAKSYSNINQCPLPGVAK